MITVLVGKSGSGKTTVAKMLEKMYGFEKIVTYTTRDRRLGETNGKDYHFVSQSEFDSMKESGKFLESRMYHAWFGDVSYGSLTSDYLKTDSPQNRVVILNPDGVIALYKEKELRDDFDEIYCFYLEADDDTLMNRLFVRGDNPKEIYRRLDADDEDFEKIPESVMNLIHRIDVTNTSPEEVCEQIVMETIL